MTPEEEARARDIFTRSAKLWTKEDDKFLEGLFKRGFRQRLKDIRAEING